MTRTPIGILERIEALEARIAALEQQIAADTRTHTHVVQCDDEFPAADLITTSVRSGALNFWFGKDDDEHVRSIYPNVEHSGDLTADGEA